MQGLEIIMTIEFFTVSIKCIYNYIEFFTVSIILDNEFDFAADHHSDHPEAPELADRVGERVRSPSGRPD